MKSFYKIVIMTICLFVTALFTSACGGSGKTTPPSYPFLLTQNNQQQENNNQQQQQNNNQNNQQEENNNEEEANETKVTLTLADSLNADKIATADIFYKIESTAKSTNDDKEILKATPNADDNTKFTVTVTGTSDPANVKIKAVITYDSEGNLLDNISSYEGFSGNKNEFAIDFGNSKDNKEGFGGGSGTEDDPYVISAPRHFANINKKDDEGNYLYLDKNFKQDEDIDFTHLTGLKIVNAEDDKDITIETVNEKAPFYNNGQGITPIGEIGDTSTAEGHQNCFKGNYDGNNKIIDGIMLVNPDTIYVSLFPGFIGDSLKNINIGANSIIYLDKILDKPVLYIGTLTTLRREKNTEEEQNSEKRLIENCINNCKIVLKNSNIGAVIIAGISSYDQYKIKYTNCTNNGNISVTNNKISFINIAGCFHNNSDSYCPVNKCINNGIIKVANNKVLEVEGSSGQSAINVSGIFLNGDIQSDYYTGSDDTTDPIVPFPIDIFPINPVPVDPTP